MLRKAFSCAAFAFLILMPAVSGSAGTDNPESLENLVNNIAATVILDPPSPRGKLYTWCCAIRNADTRGGAL